MKYVREAVSGPTFEVLYVDIRAAGADGDAVVTGADGAVGDVDLGGIAQVDSVGVGAVFGGGDRHPGYLDVAAVDHFAVEPHCIHQIDVAYVPIRRRLEREALFIHSSIHVTCI